MIQQRCTFHYCRYCTAFRFGTRAPAPIRGIERSKRSLGPTRDTLHERIHARRSSLIDKTFEILDEPPINVEELYDYWISGELCGFFRVWLDKRLNELLSLELERDLNIRRICCFDNFKKNVCMFSYNNWLVIILYFLDTVKKKKKE